MGKRLLGSLLAMLLLAVATVGGATGVAADQNYTCPESACSFTVPDFYSELNKDSTSITFKDANSGGAFNVLIIDDATAFSLDDIATAAVQQFATLNGYTAQGGITRANVGGNPARRVVFQAVNDSGALYTQNTFVTTYQGRTYLLSFATTPDAEDDFIASAQPVLDSFTFM